MAVDSQSVGDVGRRRMICPFCGVAELATIAGSVGCADVECTRVAACGPMQRVEWSEAEALWPESTAGWDRDVADQGWSPMFLIAGRTLWAVGDGARAWHWDSTRWVDAHWVVLRHRDRLRHARAVALLRGDLLAGRITLDPGDPWWID
jgi:hypothetical protein